MGVLRWGPIMQKDRGAQGGVFHHIAHFLDPSYILGRCAAPSL